VTCFGIDVSKWQSNLPDLSTVQFLFARASIGTTKDSMYPVHIGNAKVAGIVTGAYHFNVGSLSVASQVTTFIASAGHVDMYWVDVEGDNAFSKAQTQEFIRLMHEAGMPCGLYHSQSGYFEAGQDYNWVAKWGVIPPLNPKWQFWQYTSDGRLPGYSGRLDFDRFNGTLAELHILAGMAGPDSGTEEPVVIVSNETPMLVDLAVGTQLYDGSGNPLVKVSVKQTQASPWEVEFNPNFHARAMTVTTGGKNVVAYAHNADVAMRPIPAQDCAAQIAADRSKAYVAYKP